MSDLDVSPEDLRPGSLRQRLRPVLLMAAACFRADPVRAAGSIALRTTASLSGPVFAAALAALVDAARPEVHNSRAVIAAVVLAVAVGARIVVDELGWKIAQVVEEKTSLLVDKEILGIVSGLPGLEHFESPKHLNRIERIRDEQWLLSMSVQALINTFVLILQIGATVVLLASVDPLLLLLPLCALPAVWGGARAERIWIRTSDANFSDWRATWDLLQLTTKAAPAKELRVFGLGPELLRRNQALAERMAGWQLAARLEGAKYLIVGRLAFVAGYAGALGLVAQRVAQGNAPLRDLVLTAALSGQVMMQVQGATGSANWLAWTLSAVRRYVWLLDYAAERRTATDGGAERLPAPSALIDGITFSGVSFRYPGVETDVLRDVDLHLPAGATVAIVGDNGAGKTTLVKLLCRFYVPSEGRITVDGVDLTAVDVESWRAATAAAFQDHARLEFVARDAVAIGDLSVESDDSCVVDALERAGSADVIDSLPKGLDTQLGAQWPGGVDVSGGEWQKLALGRGMMRNHPLLLLLDEPTAALDAETEHRLFERYAAAAHAAGDRTGSITVLVSHRFSTVRMADLIVVVADGHVAEVGSHAELMASDGRYAELFTMQARAYR